MPLVRFVDLAGNEVMVDPQHVVEVTEQGDGTLIVLSVPFTPVGPPEDRNKVVVRDTVDGVRRSLNIPG